MSTDTQAAAKPSRKRLLCYYGDDFTGSTDVLESLFHAGVSTILFLEPPSTALLQEGFQDVSCFGVAGVGRSLSPEEMEQQLRPILETLRAAGAAVVHYKICSTFDSSPGTGSIGKAAEIGRDVFGGSYIPLLVGVPHLRRYTMFGNHFAAGGETVYRLDRHPTMSQHPVTPMAESDIRRHLEKQTRMRTSLFDILALDGAHSEVRERLTNLVRKEQPEMLLFDVLDEGRLETAGQLIWEEAGKREGLFVVGSSGVEYALSAAWRSAEMLTTSSQPTSTASPVDRLLVISGSCSPVTERQIQSALEAGYVGIRVPMNELIHPANVSAVLEELRQEASTWLALGRSVILYSASGPQDSSIQSIRETLKEQGLRAEDSSRLLGMALGSLAKQLIQQTGLSRILIAGGDTSGYVTRELGIYALACKATLDPGGPLCRAYSHDPQFDGLELVLKGGQVGGDNFIEKVRLGSDVQIKLAEENPS